MEEAVVKLRTPRSENGCFAQSFDVGLCASCRGGDTCHSSRFCSRELRQVFTASKWGLPSVG
ncbi:Hypothetical predicted protein [Prunus dulcis]|uniref:Uncharacterized protein n=1 Tax=Prunus dulcis TaxID=3755 RepID=A0A5E4FVT3_PRUDU|nr:Hypothetical predicted protein [Prunus dulcis]